MSPVIHEDRRASLIMDHSNQEPLTQDEEVTLGLAQSTPNGESLLLANSLDHVSAWSLAARGLLNVIDGRVFLTAVGALVLAPILAAVIERAKNPTNELYSWKPTPFPVAVTKKS